MNFKTIGLPFLASCFVGWSSVSSAVPYLSKIAKVSAISSLYLVKYSLGESHLRGLGHDDCEDFCPESNGRNKMMTDCDFSKDNENLTCEYEGNKTEAGCLTCPTDDEIGEDDQYEFDRKSRINTSDTCKLTCEYVPASNPTSGGSTWEGWNPAPRPAPAPNPGNGGFIPCTRQPVGINFNAPGGNALFGICKDGDSPSAIAQGVTIWDPNQRRSFAGNCNAIERYARRGYLSNNMCGITRARLDGICCSNPTYSEDNWGTWTWTSRRGNE
ncbi:MAG: hypothetical protein AB8G05_15740 [Oligoflexales bacterium]